MWKMTSTVMLLAVFAALIESCGYSQFAGETKIVWPTTHGNMTYYNNRDFQGLDAQGNPEKGQFKIKLEQSKSNEQAIAAAAQSMAQAQANLTEALKDLVSIVKSASVAFATKGAVVPPITPSAPVVVAPAPKTTVP